MATVMAYSLGNLQKAIWTCGPAWVGGDLNDVEVRAVTKIALSIGKKLYGKARGGANITVNELAAAVLQHYFSR